MARRSARVRNVHVILALSAGLVLLVLGTFGWMGWRVLGDARRREDVAKVMERSALDASADQLVALFRRNVDDRRSALDAMAASSLQTPSADGTVLVRLSRHGVEDVQPPGGLLFAPAVPRGELPPEVFARVQRLEFEAMQFLEPQASGSPERPVPRRHSLGAVRAALEASANSPNPHVRADALSGCCGCSWRAAVSQRRRRATHGSATRNAWGRRADLPPCGFLARFLWISRARAQTGNIPSIALRPPVPYPVACRRGRSAPRGFLSAEWLMRRATCAFDEQQLRELIGDSPTLPRAPASAVATADLIEVLWNEWLCPLRLSPPLYRRSSGRPERSRGTRAAVLNGRSQTLTRFAG